MLKNSCFFSKNFPGASRREIALKFSILFDDFPVFGMGVMMTCLNFFFGKYPDLESEAFKMSVNLWIIVMTGGFRSHF